MPASNWCGRGEGENSRMQRSQTLELRKQAGWEEHSKRREHQEKDLETSGPERVVQEQSGGGCRLRLGWAGTVPSQYTHRIFLL